MTPTGIDPAILQFLAQCLNHCATRSVPRPPYNSGKFYREYLLAKNFMNIAQQRRLVS
jgi:hypothetical protein